MSKIILTKSITINQIKDLAKQRYGDMVKAVIDIEQELIAWGGDMYADEEEVLLEQGSEQRNLWGFNLYPDLNKDEWLEFDSMINIRPNQNNRSRTIEDPAIQAKITELVNRMVS